MYQSPNTGFAADRVESLWIAIQANARAIRENSTVV
jgi:hypothetical protein